MDAGKTTKWKVKRRKPPFKWTPDMEKKLIEEWKERVHELQKTKRNFRIYVEISQLLGVNIVSAEEVHVKIQNMTKKYRREKAQIVASGGKPSDRQHYNEIHQMLGSFSSHNSSPKEESFEIFEDLSTQFNIESTNDAPSCKGEDTKPTFGQHRTASSPVFVFVDTKTNSSMESSSPTASSSCSTPKKYDQLLELAIAESKAARENSAKMIGLMQVLVNTVVEMSREQNKLNNEFLKYLKRKDGDGEN